MKLLNKRFICLALAVIMLLGMMPITVFAEEVEEVVATAELKGKKLSVLGASISTYEGISNNSSYNSTIGSNAVYYTEGRYGIYANDTWWMQAANDLGLELLVNNSWSGSSLLYERNGTVGAYVDRCVQLHNNAGEEPDIIGIQMGTNDFQYYKDTLGTADIDYTALITKNEDGTYTYAEPKTSLEAAAIVLHKISVRYPNAEVYYLNISQRVDGTDDLIRSFNVELKQVVEHFGAHIVDIYGSAITMDDFDTYIGDGRVHPNTLGMDAYTEAFKRAVIANTDYTVSTHTVRLDLDDVTADYGDDKIVVSGDAFSVKLTAADSLNVTVTMGGEDITASAYSNGTVTIDEVTDDVTITASSVHISQKYRWEFNGTDLACVYGNNALTKNGGTTADGMFTNTKYALTDSVVLKHDMPWAVEWKCEGTFQNSSSSSGARIFTSTDVNSEYNARYIFKSNKNGIVAMGEKTSTGSHNYGIALGDHDIDWTAEHTYRLENRIFEDGSNMVYLLVDGVEIGAMNHYYVGTTDQNATSDWVCGKDFVFPYMGTDTHGFTNASIEYIYIDESVHSHTYKNGACTVCGEEDPDALLTLEQAVTELREKLVAREKVITLNISSASPLTESEATALFQEAVAHTGNPKEGDYIRANMLGYSTSISSVLEGGVYRNTVTFTPNWISSAEMEAEVDAAVKTLLNELDLWDASNYEKVKGVYDWITENVKYDYDWDDLEDDVNYYKHTTHAALVAKNVVCQGFASLYYRLMLELGVDCRYISGVSTDITGTENHAWNIVYLDGFYYNMDATWDAGLTGYYRHFLCTEANFSGHTRKAEYDTEEFHAKYPMATLPYVQNVTASGKVNGNISWVLDGDTGALTVVGSGAIPSYRYSHAPWYEYRESVQKIVVSEGITEVGERAFYWCTTCTEVVLPESLTAIREYAFNNLRALQSITLPSKLKTIEFCAFSECTALKSITLPDSVTTVESNAFSNCYELTSAVLSSGMTSIPSSMFGGDRKLKSIVIPDSITNIGNTAFIDCGFVSVTIPASVTSLGTSVFSGCTSLTKFIVEEGNTAYKTVDGVLFTADGTHLICYPAAKYGNYTIPEGTKYIDYGAFRSQKYMSTVYFPSTLIKIEGYAFSYCKNLYSITFPANIKSIGDDAFRSCTNLYYVTFENQNVDLAGYTFANCTSLTSVTLPTNISKIPNGMFDGCTKLKSITIPKSVTEIGSTAFCDCDSLTTVTIPGNVKSIGQQAFDFCNKLETIIFEEGVTTLGWIAIRNAPKLKKVVLPSSLTTIVQPSGTTSTMFENCPNLTVYVNCGTYAKSYADSRGLKTYVYHPYTKSTVIKPTCTASGYTLYHCVCETARYSDDYVAATGHAMGDWAQTKAPSCTESGEEKRVCNTCGYSETRELSATGHTYTPTVTAPTCTAQGFTTYTCSCGESYVGDYVEATGIHTYENGVCTGCGLIRGDMNGDKNVDTDDAIYLLRHVLMPSSYPAAQNADVNGDGLIDTDDAIYLLRHVLLPGSYPLK